MQNKIKQAKDCVIMEKFDKDIGNGDIAYFAIVLNRKKQTVKTYCYGTTFTGIKKRVSKFLRFACDKYPTINDYKLFTNIKVHDYEKQNQN